ncbi:MAG TPA: hypothetical protein VFK69_14165 [Candidatus Eisenbacteria bacterium]|nr:hypothetical protein [Candidatus Eisenbacteria bacterium]
MSPTPRMAPRSKRGRPAAGAPTLARIIPIESARSRDLRWSRIAAARARIAAGWYERDEVQSRLADAVLEELNRK